MSEESNGFGKETHLKQKNSGCVSLKTLTLKRSKVVFAMERHIDKNGLIFLLGLLSLAAILHLLR